MKWISLVLLTLQTSTQVFVIKWARAGNSGRPYLSTSIVLFTEVVKMIVSFGLEALSAGSVEVAFSNVYEHFTRDMRDTLKVMVPSLLYTVQNNLMYISLANLSMAVQQVTYQLKILTTALLSMLILGKNLSAVRWLSLFLLVGGVSLVQWPSGQQSGLLHGMAGSDPVMGLLAVIAACFTSGLASVYLEKLLKKTDASIWVRNVQLGFFGSVMGLLTALVSDGKAIAEGGFFQGFNERAVCVILTASCGGLLCAAVLKYADNISRCFSTALSIILTSVLSWVVLEEFEPSYLFVLGTIIALLSTFLYTFGMPGIFSRKNMKPA